MLYNNVYDGMMCNACGSMMYVAWQCMWQYNVQCIFRGSIWVFPVKTTAFFLCLLEVGRGKSSASSDRVPNNLCKKRRTAAGELYIIQKSWPFSSSLTLFLSIHIYFRYFYRTNERIAKIRVSKYPILRF